MLIYRLKHSINKILLLILILTGCANPQLNLRTGYIFSEIRGYTTTAIPLNLQINTPINILKNPWINTRIGIEYFINQYTQPTEGINTGITTNLTLITKTEPVNAYLEFSVGPSYLSYYTNQQEEPGFNFIDQVGIGVQINITNLINIDLGYRLSHISHAGLRNSNNKGIETNSILIGATINY